MKTFSQKLIFSTILLWLFFFILDAGVSLILFFLDDSPNFINYLVFIILGAIILGFIIFFVVQLIIMNNFIKKKDYVEVKGLITNRGKKFPLFFSVNMEVTVKNKTYQTGSYFSNTSYGKYLNCPFICYIKDDYIVLVEKI